MSDSQVVSICLIQFARISICPYACMHACAPRAVGFQNNQYPSDRCVICTVYKCMHTCIRTPFRSLPWQPNKMTNYMCQDKEHLREIFHDATEISSMCTLRSRRLIFTVCHFPFVCIHSECMHTYHHTIFECVIVSVRNMRCVAS